jgi:hypothetical protein
LHTKLNTYYVNIVLKIEDGGAGHPYVQVNVLKSLSLKDFMNHLGD